MQEGLRDAVFLLGIVPPLIIDTVGKKWKCIMGRQIVVSDIAFAI